MSILHSGKWHRDKPGAGRLKVHVGGEPQPLAVEASAEDGWCDVLRTNQFGFIDLGAGRKRLTGTITFVAIAGE